MSSNLDKLTKDILELKKQTIDNMIEIGKKLIEVKESLPHGQFGKYLKEEVDFSIQTANKYMKVVREFSNYATLRNLEPSKLIILLDVPKDNLDEFTSENDLKNMSCGEIRDKIKEVKNARKKTKKETNDNEEQETKEEYNDHTEGEFEGFNPFGKETKEEYDKRKEKFEEAERERFREFFKEEFGDFDFSSRNKRVMIDATPEEKVLLKNFYKTLAKQYHPDKGGSDEAMHLISKLKTQWGID